MKLANKYLSEIAKLSVADALKSTSAEKEKNYQNKLSKQFDKEELSNKSNASADEAEVAAAKFKGAGGMPQKSKQASDSSLKNEPGESETNDKSLSKEPSDDGDFSPSSINVDAIIDKLNIVRSGRSTKDKEIKTQMDSYVKNLDDAERVALYGFLKGLGDIMASNVPASKAKEPDDEPYGIKMKRVKDLEVKRKEEDKQKEQDVAAADKALVAKKEQETAPKETTPEEISSEEDTTPPIRAGQKTSEAVRRKMKSLLF